MKELEVTVQQTPGVIHWNYEEIKAQLSEEMDERGTRLYTDENMPDARKDLAYLRNLKKQVNDRKKEIKNKCLEPYATVETQAKELIELIDKPIESISEQVTDYDNRKREERKNRIVDYMDEKFKELPGVIRQHLKFKTYSSKWENANTAVKEWKTAIDEAYESCASDIAKLKDAVEEAYLPEAMKAYERNLNITEAESAYNKYLQHKVKIMAAEQKRKEEEMRRQHEEELLAAQRAEEKKADEETAPVDESTAAIVKDTIDDDENAASPNQPETEHIVRRAPYAILRITGAAEQIEKVKGYARYCGATVEVLEEG